MSIVVLAQLVLCCRSVCRTSAIAGIGYTHTITHTCHRFGDATTGQSSSTWHAHLTNLPSRLQALRQLSRRVQHTDHPLRQPRPGQQTTHPGKFLLLVYKGSHSTPRRRYPHSSDSQGLWLWRSDDFCSCAEQAAPQQLRLWKATTTQVMEGNRSSHILQARWRTLTPLTLHSLIAFPDCNSCVDIHSHAL